MVGTTPSAGGAQILAVRRAESLTPRMRRITLACEEPGLFAGDAMHVRLLVPCPGGELRTADGRAAVSRYYTVRQIRPEPGEIDIDVLLHAPSGPGCCWAAAVSPGERQALIGPVGRPVPALGRLVLIGDETALPVIARLIEEAGPNRPIDALVEVAGPSEEQPVACGPYTRLNWLHRSADGRSHLAQAAGELDWREREGVFVYAGVEAGVASALLTRARERLALTCVQHRIVTYWRRRDEHATAA